MKKTLIATAITLSLGLSAQSYADGWGRGGTDIDIDHEKAAANNGSAAANDESLAIAKANNSDNSYTDNSKTDNSKDIDVSKSYEDNDSYSKSVEVNKSYEDNDSYSSKKSYEDNDTYVSKKSYEDNDTYVSKKSYEDNDTYVSKKSYEDNDTYTYTSTTDVDVDLELNVAVAATELEGTVSNNRVNNSADSDAGWGHGRYGKRGGKGGSRTNMTANNRISHSFNGAKGITMAAQNAGNMGLVQQGVTVQANMSLGN